MSTLTAIIIDDEERARRSLSNLIKEFCTDVNILATCSNVPDGVIAINEHKPALVFLDIEMPDYNGFELLNFFREVDFEIVFVTAYSEYALKAFEVSAVDYLMKPVDIDQLKNAVEKTKAKIKSNDIKERIDLLKENFHSQEFKRIALPVSDGLLFVETDNIVLLQADESYTHVWLKDGSRILVSKKLLFFEKVLANRKNFSRVHRSYIINFNFVSKYNKSESLLMLDNNLSVPVPKDKKAIIEKTLKEIKVGS